VYTWGVMQKAKTTPKKWLKGMIKVAGVVLMGSAAMQMAGCASAYEKSLGGDTEKVFSKIYLTEINTAWSSTLDALKSIPLDSSNRESGFIQTKWVDNTAQKNFVDSFSSAQIYQKARYRFRLVLTKGSYNGEASVRISIQKDQMVQQDLLEGWKPSESDGVEENTLLYRIGRLVVLENKRIEDEEAKRDQETESLE
jgi:hypothetical protein